MSVQGNNEAGAWCLESSSRQSCMMSSSGGSQHSVTCFSVISPDRVITGGSDCKLRYWQLVQPQEVVTLGQQENNVAPVTNKLVQGCQMFTESGGGARGGRGESEAGGRITADIQHTDWLTDMTLCHTQQPILVTASNDGVIKLWK